MIIIMSKTYLSYKKKTKRLIEIKYAVNKSNIRLLL